MKYIIFIFITISLVFAFSNCAPPAHDDVASEKIGNYRSPFADDKLKLDLPQTKFISTKQGRIKKAFNTSDDAIPSSVLLNVSCAVQECAGGNQSKDVGRLTCFGHKKMLKENWPQAINRFSFTFNFEKGETLDQIRERFNADELDQKCIVGISNYGEFKPLDIVRVNTLNDPDIALTNTNYAASPYLDQIGFFDQIPFIYQLEPQLKTMRVGIIDGDFYPGYSDTDWSLWDHNLTGFSKQYVNVGGILNVGGAPMATSCDGGCHGTLVTQLIAGTNGNSSFGAGLISGPAAINPPVRLMAANVYSLDPVSAEKIIALDSVNNALALMAFRKVDVINISLGSESTSTPDTLLASILAAVGSGSVVVVAAGNRSVNMTLKKTSAGVDVTALTYPGAWGADYLGVISVASLNKEGLNLASFSNYGSGNVDIAAPGEHLLLGGKVISGTSFSAALVAAAVAITKAYYRSQNGSAEISAAQVELTFLEGTRQLSSINDYVKNGRVLDLNSLRSRITAQGLAVAPSAKLDTDGFWYTREGTSMTYSIRTVSTGITATNSDGLFIGVWEKMDMSLPPLAFFEASNGINNFQLPYHQFIVGDEGVWIVLFRKNLQGKRIPISSRLYKFTEVVTTPTIANTIVKGAITEINNDVAGWACLPGRPERLRIEVRTGSSNGPVVESQITAHQPKGRGYFDECSPFTVRMGFLFPITAFIKNIDYYFRAVHPGNDRSKDLAINAEAFRIEDTQYSNPVVTEVKKSVDMDKVVITGRVCWVDQKTAGIISNQVLPYVSSPDYFSANPPMKAWLAQLIAQDPRLNTYYQSTYVQDGVSKPAMNFAYDILGVFHESWSTTDGVTAQTPVARVGNMGTPYKLAQIPYRDSFIDRRGYGALPIVYENDKDGRTENNKLLFSPRFVDASQKDFIFEPDFSTALYSSVWTRSEVPILSYDKENNPGVYEAYTGTGPASVRSGWDNPSSLYGSQTTVTEATTACLSINKTGFGQNFRITYSTTVLANEFNMGVKILGRIDKSYFTVPTTQAEADQMMANLNLRYSQDLNTNGAALLRSIIDSGYVKFNLRFISPGSGFIYQGLWLKDLPNQ